MADLFGGALPTARGAEEARRVTTQLAVMAGVRAVLAGEARYWRPHNGCEGEGFIERWCAGCAVGAATCRILDATMEFQVGDAGYPVEWIEDAEGQRCTRFEARS